MTDGLSSLVFYIWKRYSLSILWTLSATLDQSLVVVCDDDLSAVVTAAESAAASLCCAIMQICSSCFAEIRLILSGQGTLLDCHYPLSTIILQYISPCRLSSSWKRVEPGRDFRCVTTIGTLRVEPLLLFSGLATAAAVSCCCFLGTNTGTRWSCQMALLWKLRELWADRWVRGKRRRRGRKYTRRLDSRRRAMNNKNNNHVDVGIKAIGRVCRVQKLLRNEGGSIRLEWWCWRGRRRNI